MIKETKIRYAIIHDLNGSEYIYKSYVSRKQLNISLGMFKKRVPNAKCRVCKIRITVEEVE